jgi:hypothetical protein
MMLGHASTIVSIGQGYVREMNHVMKVVDALGCSEDDISSAGLRLTVVDWARLVCPELGRIRSISKFREFSTCNEAVHGFEKILKDGVHPSGAPGTWLVRTLLAVVIEEITQQHLLPMKHHSARPMENPLSKHLLTLSPPDGDPDLKDLVSSHYLCPHSDLNKLEARFNASASHRYASYKDRAHYPLQGGGGRGGEKKKKTVLVKQEGSKKTGEQEGGMKKGGQKGS